MFFGVTLEIKACAAWLRMADSPRRLQPLEQMEGREYHSWDGERAGGL